MSSEQPIGSIVWTDLTVEDAASVRDFYAAVVGWKYEPVSMGNYDDFNMTNATSGTSVAGICHARSPNTALPAQWLVYIIVSDLDTSISTCVKNGGLVLVGPRDMGPEARYCIIQDPAGAVAALFEQHDVTGNL